MYILILLLETRKSPALFRRLSTHFGDCRSWTVTTEDRWWKLTTGTGTLARFALSCRTSTTVGTGAGSYKCTRRRREPQSSSSTMVKTTMSRKSATQFRYCYAVVISRNFLQVRQTPQRCWDRSWVSQTVLSVGSQKRHLGRGKRRRYRHPRKQNCQPGIELRIFHFAQS